MFIIAIGVHLTGLLPTLGRRTAPRPSSLTSRTAASGFVLGMAFGVGFTPTLGPVLATVFTLASGEATVAWGAVLLTLYSIGFGIPFVAMALGLQRATRSVRWLPGNLGRLQVGGGVVLVGVRWGPCTGCTRGGTPSGEWGPAVRLRRSAIPVSRVGSPRPAPQRGRRLRHGANHGRRQARTPGRRARLKLSSRQSRRQ